MLRLGDFVIRVNLDGWYIKGFGTSHGGQVYTGEQIHPRMIEAVENKEKFVKNSVETMPVCVLIGGTVDDYRTALLNHGKKVEFPPAPRTLDRLVTKPVVVQKEVVEPDEEEKDVIRKPKKAIGRPKAR